MKLDHVLSSCIVEVVYVVKVVIIVGTQSTLCSSLAKRLIDMMMLPQSQTRLGSSGPKWLSTSIVTSFEASIIEKNSIMSTV